MVLVASGPHGSGNASGSIGPDTYSHNRFGQYVRNRTKPINPKTTRQVGVRTALSACAARWLNVVTAAQRAGWDLYGSSIAMKNALGQNMLLSGYAHYLRTNIALSQAENIYIDAPPTVFALPGKDPALAITAATTTQLVSVSFDATQSWAAETGGRLLLLCGKPKLATRNFFAGPWRYMGDVDGSTPTPPTSPKTFTAPFTFAAGQKLWVQARILRADGRMTEPFQVSAVASA